MVRSSQVLISSAEGSIIPGETATYIAYFIINQGVVDAGGVSNTGSVTASSPGNSNDVSDISDDGDDTDGNTTNDSTDINITASPTIEVTKTFTLSDNGDGKTGAGDSIVYLIKVENKGNVTLSGLSITDTLTDGNGNSLSFNNSPTFSGSTQGSAEGTLKPNETASYTALYIISSNVANTPKVINSAIATASSPGQSNNVSDTSDDGDDSDGNTDDDQTETLITESPSIGPIQNCICNR